jgi:hypothetical protein
MEVRGRDAKVDAQVLGGDPCLLGIFATFNVMNLSTIRVAKAEI